MENARQNTQPKEEPRNLCRGITRFPLVHRAKRSVGQALRGGNLFPEVACKEPFGPDHRPSVRNHGGVLLPFLNEQLSRAQTCRAVCSLELRGRPGEGQAQNSKALLPPPSLHFRAEALWWLAGRRPKLQLVPRRVMANGSEFLVNKVEGKAKHAGGDAEDHIV